MIIWIITIECSQHKHSFHEQKSNRLGSTPLMIIQAQQFFSKIGSSAHWAEVQGDLMMGLPGLAHWFVELQGLTWGDTYLPTSSSHREAIGQRFVPSLAHKPPAPAFHWDTVWSTPVAGNWETICDVFVWMVMKSTAWHPCTRISQEYQSITWATAFDAASAACNSRYACCTPVCISCKSATSLTGRGLEMSCLPTMAET